jgi:V/A-type H+-transporting ATPase subunit E
MAEKVAADEKGTLLLSAKDAGRDSTIFEKKLSKAGVNVVIDSKTADIDSGFVLKYGDIEINMSFGSLLNEKKEQLEDTVNKLLFAD